MKNFIRYGIGVVCTFGLVACDAVIDEATDLFDDDDGGDNNEIIDPPSDLSFASVINTDSDATVSGASEALEDAYRLAIFDRINFERTSAGLFQLAADVRLTELAAEHNLYMEAQAQLADSSDILISHDNFDDRAGQVIGYGYESVSENVGAVRGFAATEVVNALIAGWNNSDGHRENIVGDFTHTGVSVLVDSSDGTIYVTQIFAEAP